MPAVRCALVAVIVVMTVACGAVEPAREQASETASVVPPGAPHPSILLITLDTTRADRVGYARATDARATDVGAADEGTATPVLDRLAARGLAFEHAYATAPMTLPSHVSMMTGRYPSAHGVHENARYLSAEVPVLAEQLAAAGYATAAFVSGYPLARAFGLARGFDHYDDDFTADATERDARATTDRALAYLERRASNGPVFVWVHYFDAHDPYAPPEPFRSQYAGRPYDGEIAYVDQQMGRLIDAFEARAEPATSAILVVGDHGEGLGEHGESLHGNLLFQGTIQVPMVVVAPGVEPARRPDAVSVRQVHDTVLAWAGHERPGNLLTATGEPVLAEALRPFLQYGWQPQVMAVLDGVKVIRDGEISVFDLAADPHERSTVAGAVTIDPALRQALRAALRDYPIAPESPADEPAGGLSEEARARLASLGYAAGVGRAPVRADAPNPRAMTATFAALDRGSRLFAAARFGESIPVLQAVLDEDPHNLMVCVRLAVAHSMLDRSAVALELFARARSIDPAAIDVRHYQAMHHLRARQWDAAAPLFESVLSDTPNRLPAIEGLAHVREAQGRLDDAVVLLERAAQQRSPTAASLARLGSLHMAQGHTVPAIAAFEHARAIDPIGFAQALELGVLYLAARRFDDARGSLDAVPNHHPGYVMALFKRAQVSVLLGEPDRVERIRRAHEQGDATTRPLIEREAMFADLDWR